MSIIEIVQCKIMIKLTKNPLTMQKEHIFQNQKFK